MFSGDKVSKQAVFERLNGSAVQFARQLVEKVVIQKLGRIKKGNLFASFNRVLLQDSTNLGLHKSLSSAFPGSSNQAGKNATAKIQTIFDMVAMRFVRFSLDSFTQNDQSASGNILATVKTGDLVIRDLGYFSIPVFKKLTEKRVRFLSRLRYGVTLTDKQGRPIRIKELLKRNCTDSWVYVGGKQKLWVRLLLIPVPQTALAEKIRNAKKNRDKRISHSRDYYEWLRYNVYITTVDDNLWTASDVFQAYQTRWQIEIIFKSWKSGFKLQEVLGQHTANERRVRISIWLILLFCCLFMQKLYVNYRDKIKYRYDRQISILKLSITVFKHLVEVITLSEDKRMDFLASYCCYEKRNDRVNMNNLFKL